MPVTELRPQPAETKIHTPVQVFHILLILSFLLYNSLSTLPLDLLLTGFIHFLHLNCGFHDWHRIPHNQYSDFKIVYLYLLLDIRHPLEAGLLAELL
jgi:hypothetical protein